MAQAVSAPNVLAQRREEIARAIHEGWHDPQHPGHGIVQPEDYACADRVLALVTAWRTRTAQAGDRAGVAVSTPAAAMPIREGGPTAWTLAEALHVTTEGHECRMHGYRNCCACIVSAARWLLGHSLEQARELEEYHQLTRESAEVSEAGLAAIRFLTLGLPPTHTWTVAEIRARAAAQETP
jgi:hypothetical protein